MPYFNGNIDQTQQYKETLELLQDLLDTYSSGTPCMIMGDFNAALPQQSTLQATWYKSRPYKPT